MIDFCEISASFQMLPKKQRGKLFNVIFKDFYREIQQETYDLLIANSILCRLNYDELKDYINHLYFALKPNGLLILKEPVLWARIIPPRLCNKGFNKILRSAQELNDLLQRCFFIVEEIDLATSNITEINKIYLLKKKPIIPMNNLRNTNKVKNP